MKIVGLWKNHLETKEWSRARFEGKKMYTSNIAFLPNDPDHLFQGSENPLDIVWLARYDINDPARCAAG